MVAQRIIEEAAERGQAAFWEEVRRHFPMIKEWDLPPLARMDFDKACEKIVRRFVEFNQPRNVDYLEYCGEVPVDCAANLLGLCPADFLTSSGEIPPWVMLYRAKTEHWPHLFILRRPNHEGKDVFEVPQSGGEMLRHMTRLQAEERLADIAIENGWIQEIV